MLSEWEAELDARPKEVRLSERGKMTSAVQKQTRAFIKPLFKLLKTKTTSADILKAAEKMASACLERRYAQVQESYLTMAIGNAAWPMGVTMVSIHERAGRTKIFSGQVAHVLNDETQRKYIQSVKRLMTFCEEHYPAYATIPEPK
jgi:pre-mRNA-splicing factor 18